MLNPPAVPAALTSEWPDPQLLQQLSPTAAAVAAQALEVREEVRESRQRLLDAHQPAGASWLAAAHEDRQQAAAGKTPKTWAVQRLLQQEPHLYARALALGESLGSRLDALRGRLAGDEKLLGSVLDRLGELDRELHQSACEARDHAQDGTLSKAHAALETFGDLGRQQTQLRALHRWLTGQDTQYRAAGPARVDRVTWAAYQDAREALDPPEEGQGWRDREAHARRPRSTVRSADTEGAIL